MSGSVGGWHQKLAVVRFGAEDGGTHAGWRERM